ncbi:uncharacterized protein LOC119312954 isoform X2 [Triticum dicoccoides]|uniref:uncharacterized protein n=1 Tax=Triticum aestivum TaxID=4565 RepID=UPI001890B698|nr:uncharacterized protein LOC119312954 isoform X2 [Triticum dicoccoides]XP_044391818.1 uncharacterized protein LOC123114422 [Triticum aestivum]
MPCGINLPSLGKLTLSDVKVYQDSLDALIAHSPHLEDIHLIQPAMFLDLIASKVLKRLTIDGYIDPHKGFTISAPHLVMLDNELPTCSAFQSLTSLEIGGWHLAEDLYAVLRLLKLSPRLEKLKLVHDSGKGAGADAQPTNGMTFGCRLLHSVTIQCTNGDEGVDKLVSVVVANGVSLYKIHVTMTYREYIEKRASELEDKASVAEEPAKKVRLC